MIYRNVDGTRNMAFIEEVPEAQVNKGGVALVQRLRGPPAQAGLTYRAEIRKLSL